MTASSPFGLTLLLAGLFAGCNFVGASTSAEYIFLRVRNASNLDFSSVFVAYPGVEEQFGRVEIGQSSPFKAVNGVYPYGFIEVEASGRAYRLQPIDYVGEQPLGNGRFTYCLDVEDGDLLFELEREE